MSSTSLYSTINPAAQISTNTLTLIVGSVLNTLRYQSISYTIKNTGTDTIQWKVIGGNLSDLSDAVQIQASAAVAAGAVASYSSATTPYTYYGVQIESTVDDTPGTGTLNGTAKR